MRHAYVVLLAAVFTVAGCGDTSQPESEQMDQTATAASGGFAVSAAPPPAPAPQSARPVASRREATADVAQAPDGTPATAGGAGTLQAPSMLIRTGQASIEVADVDSGVARVRALATRVGGYIANTSMEGGEHQVRSATLEVKLPAARFDDAVRGLEPIGEVESVNVHAQDVGEEFVDVGARVANARRLEARLVELLATRTGRLEDVLAVERELARVREEIERHEGRLRYLQSRVAVSTLVVTVHEGQPVLGATSTNPIAEAFRSAWRNFVGFVAWLIASMGVLLPAALIAWLGYRLWLRRRTR